MVGWISDSSPASKHDKVQQAGSNFEQVTNLANGELAMTDLGYQGIRYALLPHKKPPLGNNHDQRC
jgi:hypothetical protein